MATNGSLASAVEAAAAALEDALASAREIDDPDRRCRRQVDIAESWQGLAHLAADTGLPLRRVR